MINHDRFFYRCFRAMVIKAMRAIFLVGSLSLVMIDKARRNSCHSNDERRVPAPIEGLIVFLRLIYMSAHCLKYDRHVVLLSMNVLRRSC